MVCPRHGRRQHQGQRAWDRYRSPKGIGFQRVGRVLGHWRDYDAQEVHITWPQCCRLSDPQSDRMHPAGSPAARALASHPGWSRPGRRDRRPPW